MWRQLEGCHRANSDIEMETLEGMAKYASENSGNKLAIEIGSFCGASALLLSKFFDKVISIDPWGHETHGTGYDGNEKGMNPYFPSYMANISRFGLQDRVFPVVATSIFLETFSSLNANFIYIDGGHFYQCVKDNIQHSVRHLESKGLLTFDDMEKPSFGYPPFYDDPATKPNPHMSRVDPYIGVKQAVDEFLAKGEFEIFEHKEGLLAAQRKIVNG